MAISTVSPKYQVVIPKTVRDQMKLRPGQKLEVMVYAGRIVLIPVPSAKQMRGALKGIDTRVPREKDRV